MTKGDVLKYLNNKPNFNVVDTTDVEMVKKYLYYKKEEDITLEEITQAIQGRFNNAFGGAQQIQKFLQHMRETLVEEFEIAMLKNNKNQIIKFT